MIENETVSNDKILKTWASKTGELGDDFVGEVQRKLPD